MSETPSNELGMEQSAVESANFPQPAAPIEINAFGTPTTEKRRGRPRKAQVDPSAPSPRHELFKSPSPTKVEPPSAESTPQLGGFRVGDETSPLQSRDHSRRSGRHLARDDTFSPESGGYVCIVPGCGEISETRATQQYHMREEHPHQWRQMQASASVPSHHQSQRYSQQSQQMTPQEILQQQLAIPAMHHAHQQHHMARRVHSDDADEEPLPEDEEYVDVMEESILLGDTSIDVETEEEVLEDEGDTAYMTGSPDHHTQEAVHTQGRPQELLNRILPGVERKKRGRPRKDPFAPPAENSRLRHSDPNGRYPCYEAGCIWKGKYRSIRSAHMKAMHPDWVRPESFSLPRVSAEGVVVSPLENGLPKFMCPVDGCEWRGNYRGSRAAHIRNHHKEYDMAAVRKNHAVRGGFVPEGRYRCHVRECEWRGSSRSTRSSHMRREHANFVNTVYAQRNVPCCDCSLSLQSHKLFVDHMVTDHGVGGIVQREFSNVADYEEWFEAVQESFSIDFIKRMGVKNTSQYQVLYLYCAKGGGYRDPRFHRYNRNANMPTNTRPLGRHGMKKSGKNCAAFLRMLSWVDGRMTVIGCVEHTGHRMGTPLLRLSQSERDVMDDYLYSAGPGELLESTLEKLRDAEQHQLEGYDARDMTPDDVKKYITDDDQLTSLAALLATDDFRSNTFAVNVPTDLKGTGFTLGLMSERQRNLWIEHGKGAACIEHVSLVLDDFHLTIWMAFVFDERDVPRCAALYLSHSNDRHPLLKHLVHLCPTPPRTIVTDLSLQTENAFYELYGGAAFTVDFQFAEWHVMEEWARLCDEHVGNKVDRYAIVCALRRWLRANEAHLFEAYADELFQAMREMELHDLANSIDEHLTNHQMCKKWTPIGRNPLTENCNPILDIAVRTLRDKFLTCNFCKRIDEYIGAIVERVEEYNAADVGQVYSTQNPERPRIIPSYYEEEQRLEQLLGGMGGFHTQRKGDMVDGIMMDDEMELEMEELIDYEDDDMPMSSGGEAMEMIPRELLADSRPGPSSLRSELSLREERLPLRQEQRMMGVMGGSSRGGRPSMGRPLAERPGPLINKGPAAKKVREDPAKDETDTERRELVERVQRLQRQADAIEAQFLAQTARIYQQQQGPPRRGGVQMRGGGHPRGGGPMAMGRGGGRGAMGRIRPRMDLEEHEMPEEIEEGIYDEMDFAEQEAMMERQLAMLTDAEHGRDEESIEERGESEHQTDEPHHGDDSTEIAADPLKEEKAPTDNDA